MLAAAATAAALAAAAEQQPGSQTRPAGETSARLQATVASVTGEAERLQPGADAKWTPLKAGDSLDEMAVIRTGLRSEVVLKFADRGQAVIGAGTKVGIAEFRKKADLVTTQLGLKYGSMSVAVDSTRGPNDARVTTPVATLSVRGTQGDIGYTGGSQVKLLGQTGTWRVAVGDRTRNVAAGESTDGNLTQSIVLAKDRRDSFLAVTGITSGERRSVIDNPRPLNPTGAGDTPTESQIAPIVPPVLPGDHIIIGP